MVFLEPLVRRDFSVSAGDKSPNEKNDLFVQFRFLLYFVRVIGTLLKNLLKTLCAVNIMYILCYVHMLKKKYSAI